MVKNKETQDKILLCFAAITGDIKLIREIMETMTEISDIQSNVYRNAAMNGNLEIIRFLKENYRNDHFPSKAFYYAAMNGDLKILEYIYTQFEQRSFKPQAAFYRCCKIGAVSSIHFICTHYILPTIQLNRGLVTASQEGKMEIVKYLLNRGADIHFNNEEPLSKACGKGHIDVMQLLMEYGADFNASRNPLYSAIAYNHQNLIQYVAEAGYITQSVESHYQSALFEGFPEIAQIFIDTLGYKPLDKNNNLILNQNLLSAMKNNDRILFCDLLKNKEFTTINNRIWSQNVYNFLDFFLEKPLGSCNLSLFEYCLRKEIISGDQFVKITNKILKLEKYQILIDLFKNNNIPKEHQNSLLIRALFQNKFVLVKEILNIGQKLPKMSKETVLKLFEKIKDNNFKIFTDFGIPIVQYIDDALLIACKKADIAKIEFCLENGAHFENPTQWKRAFTYKNEEQAAGITHVFNKFNPIFKFANEPLINAVHDGDFEGTNQLLRGGIGEDLRDFILYIAIINNYRKIVELIIDTAEGDYCIHEIGLDIAVAHNYLDLVEYLLQLERIQENYMGVEESVLEFAIFHKNFDLVKLAVANGAQIDTDWNCENERMISSAIFAGNMEIFKYLVDRSDSHFVDELLICAFNRKNEEMLRYVLNKFEFQYESDSFLINRAVHDNFFEGILLLIDHGANWQFIKDEDLLSRVRKYYKELSADHPRHLFAKFILKSKKFS